MKTDTHTPADIFSAQQRLLVPLFQRPYVWNQEFQWEPMWRDIKRVLTRYLAHCSMSRIRIEMTIWATSRLLFLEI